MTHLVVGASEFRYNGRSIKFNKIMVQRVFGIPSGGTPLDFDNVPYTIANEVTEASNAYMFGKLIPFITALIFF